LPSGTILKDQRFNLVNRGCAPILDELSGRWAVDKEYSKKIKNIYKQIKET
jgi:hypothetical protein